MTNKPMLSVERELRGAVEKALLAIKRIYQAGHDGIVNAGGSCDQPSVMFEGDPTVRELRALLDKPSADFNPEHKMFNEIRTSTPVNDEGEPLQYLFSEHQLQRLRELESPAAQHQGEPVAMIKEIIEHPQTVINNRLRTRALEIIISGAEQPAPVAVVMPERESFEIRDWAGSFCQEALSFGLSEDSFSRCIRTTIDRTLAEVARLNVVKP